MVKKKNTNKKNLFFLIGLIVVVLDQITKFLAKKYLDYHLNSGSLFGMFQGSYALLIFFTIFVIGIFLFFYDVIAKEKRFVQINYGLIFGGAIGNLIDRIFYKGVVDFISLGWWPSFNVADSCISIGITLLIIYFIFEK